MEIFKCKYENHENEAILGFCLNTNCQNANQYCYKCLLEVHSDHYGDCIRFKDISDLINEYIQGQGKIKLQLNDIYNQINKQIESKIKKLDDNILALKDLNQLLTTQEYLKLKSSINILKIYYSSEQQNKEEQFINQLNEIKDNLKQIEKNNQKQQDAEKIFEKAICLTNEGKHEDALKLYDKSLSLLNINDEIFRWKGQSLIYLSRLKEAIQCCDMAIYLNPKNDNAYNNKGLALHNLNKYQDAIKYCEKAIQLNPKNDSAYNNKGLALRKLNQYENAILCYDKAIQLNPKKDITYTNKGAALNNLNQYIEAIEYFEKAIQLNPKNANSYHNKAYALHQMKQFQKAIEFYDQALSLQQNAIFYQNKAETLLALGKKLEAKKCYQNALNAESADESYIKKQLLKL